MKYLNKFLEYSKTPFILAGIIFVASLALLSIFKDAEKQLKELNNAVEISNEMAKSSDDLTNYARYYVTTRDDKWKEKFDRILKVRKGEEPDAQGKKISFKDKVNSVGFNKNELDMILKAETLSNNLAVLEVKAFESIVKGKSEGVWDVQPQTCPSVGKTLDLAELTTQSGALILAIGRPDGSLLNNPNGSIDLLAGDTFICLGTPAQLRS